jgi:hypothetical protein
VRSAELRVIAFVVRLRIRSRPPPTHHSGMCERARHLAPLR